MITPIYQYQCDFSKDLADGTLKWAIKRNDSSNSLYSQRGELNTQKQIEDLRVGLLGEIMFYNFFSKLDNTLSEPDLKHYSKKDKSFNADMASSSCRFHVKTQTTVSADSHGISWMFQKTDPLYKNPRNDDVIVMSLIDWQKLHYFFLGFCYAINIKEMNGWLEPNVERYRATKAALYFKDLKQKGLIV